MDLVSAIKERHSVREFKTTPIGNDVLSSLQKEIELCNKESGLNFELILNDSTAISDYSKYGFKNAVNYIILKGKKSNNIQENCGFYGERIVLTAQCLGLNTCWIAGTYNRKAVKNHIKKNEKLVCIIAIGYGETQGVPHKNRSIDPLCRFHGDMPKWFLYGMYAAMDAPTALNQQKFRFTLIGNNKVKVKRTGGFYSKIDLGIVKFNFLTASKKENFEFI